MCSVPDSRGPAGRGRPAAGAVLMRPDEMRQNLTGVKVKLTMTTLSTNIRLTRDREGRVDSGQSSTVDGRRNIDIGNCHKAHRFPPTTKVNHSL